MYFDEMIKNANKKIVVYQCVQQNEERKKEIAEA